MCVCMMLLYSKSGLQDLQLVIVSSLLSRQPVWIVEREAESLRTHIDCCHSTKPSIQDVSRARVVSSVALDVAVANDGNCWVCVSDCDDCDDCDDCNDCKGTDITDFVGLEG